MSNNGNENDANKIDFTEEDDEQMFTVHAYLSIATILFAIVFFTYSTTLADPTLDEQIATQERAEKSLSSQSEIDCFRKDLPDYTTFKNVLSLRDAYYEKYEFCKSK